ncbi:MULTISPECIES: hypothetical protein [Devosia]|uniref:hypothetical protein n=1 Tax=Devosia TaxID=46913 RepID=UPI000CE97A9D|nr:MULTISPECIES: hypothetical protein [Devosia]AVF03432.1 hypothetical protein C4375_06625 [Devosia sp. I507]
MQTHFQKTRHALAASPAIALVAGAIALVVLQPVPAEAQGFGVRAGAVSGENGTIAGSRSVMSNGQGGGAVRRNFAVGDGQGNGTAWSGICAANINAAGCSGRAATWSADGSFSGVAGTEIAGDNGFFSGNRTLDRDPDGSWSGSSAVEASGQNGSYNGSASFNDGTYSRGAVYSGADGQSATVEGTYEIGSGGSRIVTCIDASGAMVECP